MSKKPRKVFKGLIYHAKHGKIYDTDKRQYNCYSPANTGTYTLFDCWVCDANGNIHPGYNASPVPVGIEYLGNVVGRMDGEEEEE